MNAPERQFVRAAEDVGNIVALEHVNLTQLDQRITTIFYVQGLGLTRDPYLHVWDTNMWINIGKQQVHSPSRPVTVLRGTIGIVVPDLDVVREGLKEVTPKLEGTKFSWKDNGTTIETMCPWGNKFRVHGPEARFGDMRLGMPYIDIPVPRGTSEGIARFYEQIMLVPSRRELGKNPAAHIGMGVGQVVIYRETDDPIPPFDGHHIAIYVANFSTPHSELKRLGLVFEESDQWQYRFQDIVDPQTKKVLFTLEHEVRSLTHPMYARPLINRNSVQRQLSYVRGQDAYY